MYSSSDIINKQKIDEGVHYAVHIYAVTLELAL